MKILPCRKCGRCTLPDGSLYSIQSWPGAHPYKCASCKTKTSVSAAEFNRLPGIDTKPPDPGVFTFRKRADGESLDDYHSLRNEAYNAWKETA